MSTNFANKKVVITGGSAGIGLATAKALAQQDAHLIIASRSQDKLDRAKKEIGKNCETHKLDVSDEDAVKRFFDNVGNIDHLVTPAAGGALGPLLELPTASARNVVDSKLWGQYHTAKYGAPKLGSGSSITFFSGIVSRKPMAGTSTYTIIAGAMESLTRCLALELAPIRVNCVTPGVIDTPLWGEIIGEDQAEQNFKAVAATLPVRRVGTADDVAQAVLYLMGNGYATGTIVDVDGGHRCI